MASIAHNATANDGTLILILQELSLEWCQWVRHHACPLFDSTVRVHGCVAKELLFFLCPNPPLTIVPSIEEKDVLGISYVMLKCLHIIKIHIVYTGLINYKFSNHKTINRLEIIYYRIEECTRERNDRYLTHEMLSSEVVHSNNEYSCFRVLYARYL